MYTRSLDAEDVFDDRPHACSLEAEGVFDGTYITHAFLLDAERVFDGRPHGSLLDAEGVFDGRSHAYSLDIPRFTLDDISRMV